MAAVNSGQAVQDILAFPLRDRDWVRKLGIACGLSLANFIVPILPAAVVYGYVARMMRRMMDEGGPPVLPEWEDWGELLVSGLKLLGAALVYMLPALAVGIGGYVVMMSLPFVAAILTESQRMPIGAMPLLSIVGMLGGMAGFGLAMLLGGAAWIVLPVALCHQIAAGEFGAAFRLREWWAVLRANVSGFALTFVIFMGVSFVMTFVGQVLYLTVVLCCLMPIVMTAISTYTSAVIGALYAEAYRAGAQTAAATTVDV